MVLSQLAPELVNRVCGRIHWSSEDLLGRAQPAGKGAQSHVPDDHQVHVALGGLLSLGQGTVDEGHLDAWYIRQRAAEHLHQPHRFQDDGTKLRVDGAGGICTIVGTSGLDPAGKDAGLDERSHLIMHGGRRERHAPGDLPQVPFPAGVSKHQPQYRPPRRRP